VKDIIRLGAGSGFWGDAMDPAMELLEQGSLDYLGFDFLAELTMAILQRQKLKNPEAGYVPDVVTYMKAMMAPARERGTRLVSNGGGANPAAAARAIAAEAGRQGLRGTRIALVEGDDLLPQLDRLLRDGLPLTHMETGDEDFASIRSRVVAANVYTDASGIIEALGGGADVVVTGRVSDNAVYVGPLMHEFGWRYDSEHADRIGAAITIGHVIECAAACTGGMSSRYAEMPNMGWVGFPIVEFHRDGSAVVTKVAGTGGRVDQWTVKEHLLYEIADPRHYVMPDGVADFTTLRLVEEGQDRVRMTGMTGRPRPDRLKLVVGYQDGWIGEGMMFFPWPDALGRATKARQTLMERFERLGLEAEAIHFDLVGINMLHGPAAPPPHYEPNEVGLRVAVRTSTQEEAEKVRRACSHLWIMGPGGTSFGVPIKPRPIIALWPALVPRDLVRQTVEILEV
jgi:hypothetical protein